MSMAQKFKDFATRGSIIDVAVGMAFSGIFCKIIYSLVSDIIMPPIGVALGGVHFSDLAITISGDKDEDPPEILTKPSEDIILLTEIRGLLKQQKLRASS